MKYLKRKKFFSYLLLSIILIIFSLFFIKSINNKSRYENEGLNMTYEDKILVDQVIKLAEEKLGMEYVWGGKGEIMTEERLDELISYYGERYYPLNKEEYIGNQAFDCSGLTYWIYREVTGVEIGYSTSNQEEILKGYEVEEEDLQPGDLIFTPGHVVLYKGKGKIINAYSKYQYPIGGVKNGRLRLGKKSVIYRPLDYIKSLELDN